MSDTTHQSGNRVDIDGTVITLTSRKSRTGIRWSWIIERIDVGGEASYPTPEEAIASARKALASPPCRHGDPILICHCRYTDAGDR